jgi:branched-chain amino acid transport system ATP-binding protein
MAEPVLVLDGLQKRFGGLTATDSVSLSVARGEFRALIGPNGAGKSTLFNLITGFLHPDDGRVLIEGTDVTGSAPFLLFHRGISRTFQITNIFANLSVLENVQAALLSYRRRIFDVLRPASRFFGERAEELLRVVGLTRGLSAPASALSHGDRKKLELAIALANEPRLLFLDEPTAGMAAAERIESIRTIKRIALERGLTVMFTEHDMNVVFSVADRISVLHHGRIIAEDEPAAIRDSEEVQRVYLGGAI